VTSESLSREDASTAARLLNDLWGDILAGDGLFQMVEEHGIRFRSEDHMGYIQRMVFFHLAMVLCKLAEFHKHYSRSLPDECRAWLKSISVKVERRGLREMRNKAIGHILDNATGAPLTAAKVEEMYRRAVDGDSEAFYRWMRNAKEPGDLDTVMGRVIWLRDRIMSEHRLSAQDLGLRPSRSS